MKIAVLGKGKTGSHVIRILQERGMDFEVFDSQNRISAARLASFHSLIAFVSGPVFVSLIPELIQSGIPVITGATGLEWPPELPGQLREAGLKWIHASNFSMGMNLVHKMITTLGLADKLFDQFSFRIHEVHHVKKLDAPSGTAKKWKDWLGHEAATTWNRQGDVTGDHTLVLETEKERITLRHEALDRGIFAQGAVTALDYLKDVDFGLHSFEDLILHKLLD